MRRPRFWNDTSLLTNVLTPIGLIHNFISKQSYKLKKPYYSKAPVICIGSLIIGGGGKTIVGNNCLFMISSHIAHDCQVGNNVIIANNVPLGGHAIIEDNVVIGGNSAVQQFTRIGKMAMIGGMTGVLHDVIPYGLSTGNRNSLQGLNLIGLRRAKFENKDILGLSEAYKEIFATKNINENISKLNGSFQKNPLVKEVIEFITKDKKRSICTPFS